ncbi:MAG: phosphate/phosphite/phosphonate ABC transporter substrate-binding protein [Polyangiaceae bacterium]|nr:phosphate/phosphite/phosphonate ABC transporter substrate-binding protein [Polyangiaceae bacterium]
MSEFNILIGAVASSPRVVSFWESMEGHFRAQNFPIEYALFSNYERQVEALLAGHIDIAYSSPLAHARVKKRTDGRSITLAVADIDRGASAKIVVRRDAAIRNFAGLHGKRLAVGGRDSAQARILPLYYLSQAGVDLSKVEIFPFDIHIGKHGDTSDAELNVLAAVLDGRVHAGAVGTRVWNAENAASRIDLAKVEVLWTTPTFDLRVFDALPQLAAQKADGFQRILLAMSFKNPAHRRVLDPEGIRQWVVPREEAYAAMMAALDMGLASG